MRADMTRRLLLLFASAMPLAGWTRGGTFTNTVDLEGNSGGQWQWENSANIEWT